MSKQKMKVTLEILENSYTLMCEAHERNMLIDAADAWSNQLSEMRQSKPNMPLERMAIFAGLHVMFDLLQERQTFSKEVELVNEISERLLSSVDMALVEAHNNESHEN